MILLAGFKYDFWVIWQCLTFVGHRHPVDYIKGSSKNR